MWYVCMWCVYVIATEMRHGLCCNPCLQLTFHPADRFEEHETVTMDQISALVLRGLINLSDHSWFMQDDWAILAFLSSRRKCNVIFMKAMIFFFGLTYFLLSLWAFMTYRVHKPSDVLLMGSLIFVLSIVFTCFG